MRNTDRKSTFISSVARKLSLVIIACLFWSAANAQTTLFKFEANLPNEFTPATGSFEMEFKLYDAATGGNQIGATNVVQNVEVKTRSLAVQLDYGAAAFSGGDRFVEISYRRAGSGEPFVVVSPRRQILSVPYAIRALNATTADAAVSFTGVLAAANGGTGLSSAGTSGNFLRSDGMNWTSSPITAADIPNLDAGKITTGTLSNARLGIIPAANGGTGLNSPGASGNFLRSNGSGWVSFGLVASDIPPGSPNYIQNTSITQAVSNFSISGTGRASVLQAETQYNLGANRVLSEPGNKNLFVGRLSGANLTSGFQNTFVGFSAGNGNTSGHSNSFVGVFAGNKNTTGTFNPFVGLSAGGENTSGAQNSFFGAYAGAANTTGNSNSFVGAFSGEKNTTGRLNSFFGLAAGEDNVSGSQNSFIGQGAGLHNIEGDENSFLGSFAGPRNTTGSYNSFLGASVGNENTTGSSNSFVGRWAALNNTTGSKNSFFGAETGFHNKTGEFNTLVGYFADVSMDNLTYATAIGAEAKVSTSNTIALGRITGADKVRVYGLGAAGATALCRNADFEISNCSSSLRYKTNIAPFGLGLSLVNKLRPITFDWKAGGMTDLGLGAEEVAEIEPLLVTYNKDGQVEGVKYDRIGIVLLNAVKQQQAQIEAQQKQLDEQRQQIDRLKKIVCRTNTRAGVCKKK